MDCIVLFCGPRARVLAKPKTFGELVGRAREIFGFETDTLFYLCFNHQLPTGEAVAAELDDSAYHLVKDGMALRCVPASPAQNARQSHVPLWTAAPAAAVHDHWTGMGVYPPPVLHAPGYALPQYVGDAFYCRAGAAPTRTAPIHVAPGGLNTANTEPAQVADTRGDLASGSPESTIPKSGSLRSECSKRSGGVDHARVVKASRETDETWANHTRKQRDGQHRQAGSWSSSDCEYSDEHTSKVASTKDGVKSGWSPQPAGKGRLTNPSSGAAVVREMKPVSYREASWAWPTAGRDQPWDHWHAVNQRGWGDNGYAGGWFDRAAEEDWEV